MSSHRGFSYFSGLWRIGGGNAKRSQYFAYPAAASGHILFAFGAGFYTADVETTGTPDRDGYTLNGTKIFVTDSPIADFVLVAAPKDLR